MIRVITALAAFLAVAVSADAASVRVTTWNLEWFPNGTAKETEPAEQNKRISAAANVLRPLDPDVLLLQEVKDYDAVSRLAEAIRPHTYQVAICSAFKEPFQAGIGKQQVAILAKEPAQAAWAETWKSMEGVDPPRGFAFAWFKIHGADIGLYSVHLKSNLIMRGDKEKEAAKNIRKREIAITQLVSHIHDVIEAKMPDVKAIIVGGDFNSNADQKDFAAERTLLTLPENGFKSCFDGLPAPLRMTHPGSGRYPNATFDYLFARGATPVKPRIIKSDASDHLPVTCDFEIAGAAVAKQPELTPTVSKRVPADSGKFVTLTQPVRISVPYGEIVLPLGTRLPFVSREGSKLTVRYLGEARSIPAASTDLR